MARALIPVTQLVRNSGTVVASAGTAETSDGNYIAAGAVTGDFVLYVNNTGDAGTVTFKAGANPPSLTADEGDLALDIDGTAEAYYMIETARFTQEDGTINIDFDDVTASVAAYEVRQAGVS